MSFRRRMMMATQKDDRFELIYHWEAEDWNGGNLVDRVQGSTWTKFGSPIKEIREDGKAYLKLNTSNYFRKALNDSDGLVFGDRFKVELEYIIYNTPQSSNYLIDFGSLENATHAFGVSIYTTSKYSFNAKIKGNDSSSLYNPVKSNTPNPIIGVPNKVIFGIEAFDSTHNIVYCEVDGVKTFSDNLLTQSESTFSKNFNQSTGYFGRGVLTNYQTKDYKYIKSLKIYKDKREL